MSTIRGVKDRRFKFVQLLNSMFEDQKISLKAKGFVGFCLTKKEDWNFHISHLCSVLKEGEDAIYATINECINNGYAYRYRTRDEKGHLTEVEFMISDSKEEILALRKEKDPTNEFKKTLPHRGFPDVDNPDLENPELDLPRENRGSIYSNTNNSNTEQQQQGNAAVFSDLEKENSKKDATQHNMHDQPLVKSAPIKNTNFYQVLKEIEIPENDKVEITSRYNEDVVKKAIEWATHSKNPPTKCLSASIKFACKNGLCSKEFDKKKETAFEMVGHLFKHGEKYNGAECYLNEKSIAFGRSMKHGSVKLDKFFSWDKLEDLCKSFKIPFTRIK